MLRAIICGNNILTITYCVCYSLSDMASDSVTNSDIHVRIMASYSVVHV